MLKIFCAIVSQGIIAALLSSLLGARHPSTGHRWRVISRGDDCWSLNTVQTIVGLLPLETKPPNSSSEEAVLSRPGFYERYLESLVDARSGPLCRLLAALRKAVPAPSCILTSALPAGEWALRSIDLGKGSAGLDLISMMTCDFSGPWTDLCGHYTRLYSPWNVHNEAAWVSCSSA